MLVFPKLHMIARLVTYTSRSQHGGAEELCQALSLEVLRQVSVKGRLQARESRTICPSRTSRTLSSKASAMVVIRWVEKRDSQSPDDLV